MMPLEPLRDRRREAFALVELVIAIGIFAIAAISLLSLLTLSLGSSRKAGNQAASAAIVASVMSKFSSQSFSSNAASLPFTNYFSITGVETSATAAVYQCRVIDNSPADATVTYMRQVRLIILWPSPSYNQSNTVIGSFVKYD